MRICEIVKILNCWLLEWAEKVLIFKAQQQVHSVPLQKNTYYIIWNIYYFNIITS